MSIQTLKGWYNRFDKFTDAKLAQWIASARAGGWNKVALILELMQTFDIWCKTLSRFQKVFLYCLTLIILAEVSALIYLVKSTTKQRNYWADKYEHAYDNHIYQYIDEYAFKTTNGQIVWRPVSTTNYITLRRSSYKPSKTNIIVNKTKQP